MRKLISVILIFIMSTTFIFAAEKEIKVDKIDNQYNKPWCSAFAVCNAIETQMKAEGMETPEGGFSEAWLYARCTKELGFSSNLSNMINFISGDGILPNSLCPTENYIKSTRSPRITEEMNEAAHNSRIWSFDYLEASPAAIKAALDSDNVVIISTRTNMKGNWYDGDAVILDKDKDADSAHATYLVGYDDEMTIGDKTGFFIGVNSWGTEWGDKGKYYMTYDYIKKENFIEIMTIEVQRPPRVRNYVKAVD